MDYSRRDRISFFERGIIMAREAAYQRHIIQRLYDEFPECVVLINDSLNTPGVPDLLVLYKTKWAALEVKISARARIGPNQSYYVNLMNTMSYARFIYPENENEVFDDLQYTFASTRATRLLKRK